MQDPTTKDEAVKEYVDGWQANWERENAEMTKYVEKQFKFT